MDSAGYIMAANITSGRAFSGKTKTDHMRAKVDRLDVLYLHEKNPTIIVEAINYRVPHN